MSNFSFPQVMSVVRSTGTERMLIRIELGVLGKGGQAVHVELDPRSSNDDQLAQKLLHSIFHAANAYQRSNGS